MFFFDNLAHLGAGEDINIHQEVTGMKLVECVPNFSEGRQPEVLNKIIESIVAVCGINLLGQEMDPDHNRAVVTFAGEPDAVVDAAFRGIAKATELIDLNRHQGEHPRMGATDVCPFIPIQGVTMDECVALARKLGERVGNELQIPIFLYEEAATRPERKNLANVRQGQFEKLKELIGQDPSRDPDYGPRQIHPTAGATAIGARFFLIAYNVNLQSEEVKLAKKIARAIREKDGGFPCVKAMGFSLQDRKMVQVSMNLTDYRCTPMTTVFDEIANLAAKANVAVAESEIVGLVPLDAVEATAKAALKLTEFQSEQIIEYRLYQGRQDVLAAPVPFIDAVASADPTPGGGSVSALVGALAAALARMMIAVTAASKKYQEQARGLQRTADELAMLQKRLTYLVKEDCQAYNSFIVARRMKKGTDEEKKDRGQAIEKAIMRSIFAPLDTMDTLAHLLELLPELAENGNPNAVSDVGVACHLALAAVQGAMLNVRINLGGINDGEVKQEIIAKSRTILEKAITSHQQALVVVDKQLG